MAKIGFIGTGEIARCMVLGLAGQGHQIFVSDRNAKVGAALAADFEEVVVHDNQGVVDNSDIVWLCLMADVADTVLADILFRPDMTILSAMTDVPIARLTRVCAPATDISITIPLPFIATGGCPLPVYPDSAALHHIFGARNIVLPQTSEAAVNAHFAACAMSAAMTAQFQRGAEWLGDLTGDQSGSEAYVAALFAGMTAAVPKDGQGRFEEILKSLNTEGGLNATLRQHMFDAGVLEQLTKGLDGLKGRLGLD